MDPHHVVLEIRYAPAPRYLDNRGAIIEEFKSKYSQIQIEDIPFGPPLGLLQRHIRMKDERRGITAFVHGTHAGFEMEFEPLDIDTFAREGEGFCRTVVRDVLKVDTISRMGIRSWCRWPVSDDDISAFILQQVLQSRDEIAAMNIKGDDFRLRFETKDDDFGYTVQFYPERIEGDEGQKDVTGSLIIDTDSFRKDLPVTVLTSARETIQEALERSLALGSRLHRVIARL